MLRYERTPVAFEDRSGAGEAHCITHSRKAVTVGQLAQAVGLRTFDTALPQDWVDDVKRVTGEYAPYAGIVWCYDEARTWGRPVAMTIRGRLILERYARAKGYTDER